jgi:ribosomal protein S20
MRWRRIVLSSALAGTLVLGLALGLLSQSSLASAQTTPPADGSASSPVSRFLDNLAAALGIERTALDSAMESAAQTSVDAAVADGSLSQEQADRLTDLAAQGNYAPFFGGRGGPGGPGGPGRGGPALHGVHEAAVSAAAQALGLSVDELRTALRDGQSVAELAAANSTTEAAVLSAALAAARGELDALVAAGTLTQEQADSAYQRLEAKGLSLLERGGRGPGGRGGPPPSDESAPEAPATAPTDA